MAALRMAWVPAVHFIISMNLRRRHLNESQRAICGDTALPFAEEEAKDRMRLSEGRGKKGTQKIEYLKDRNNGLAADHVAKTFGTNRQYIADVKKIRKENPEYIDKIKSGEITIPKAKKKIKSESRKKTLTQKIEEQEKGSEKIHNLKHLFKKLKECF